MSVLKGFGVNGSLDYALFSNEILFSLFTTVLFSMLSDKLEKFGGGMFKFSHKGIIRIYISIG